MMIGFLVADRTLLSSACIGGEADTEAEVEARLGYNQAEYVKS
jgi:hypothetical protein